MIELRDLVVRRMGRTVLDVPSAILDAPVTAVLGPNGAGKSTLLRAVAGLERQARNAVTINGRPHPEARASFAFQQPVFVRGTVRHNLALGLRFRGLPEAERNRRIGEAAELTGLTGLLDRDARRLSGGEAQRANLARALALPADIILLDEPLAGLDEPSARDLLVVLPAALRQAAVPVLVVTHDRNEAQRFGDAAVILSDGRFAAQGPVPDVFRTPSSPAVARLLGFSVISLPDEDVAIAPGALQQGENDVAFAFVAESVHDLAFAREAIGRVGENRVIARVARDVRPGDTVEVGAETGRFVRYRR